MEVNKVKIIVYVPQEVKVEATAKAEKLGISLSGLMAVALNDYLKQDKAVEMISLYKQQIEMLPIVKKK